jgi:hypothetical protein
VAVALTRGGITTELLCIPLDADALPSSLTSGTAPSSATSGMTGTFPWRRLVKSCTSRFRGNVMGVVAGEQVDHQRLPSRIGRQPTSERVLRQKSSPVDFLLFHDSRRQQQGEFPLLLEAPVPDPGATLDASLLAEQVVFFRDKPIARVETEALSSDPRSWAQIRYSSRTQKLALSKQSP